MDFPGAVALNGWVLERGEGEVRGGRAYYLDDMLVNFFWWDVAVFD